VYISKNRHNKFTEQYLCWDYDYNITRDYLQPILNELSDLENLVRYYVAGLTAYLQNIIMLYDAKH